LWQEELAGTKLPGSGVSCASCHLPRIKKGKRVTIMHNQNFNLRPNTKMLKKVCMSCHGLRFSLSSLADEEIITNNFSSSPTTVHPTFELIEQRILEKKKLNQSQ
jgi:formate-dependent nitrite reductase cytochrome c552 subunit